MYNKVIYIVKADLHYYPPCMSQIQMLDDLGVNLEVWYGSSQNTAVNILSNRGIKACLLPIHKTFFFGKLRIIEKWIGFRKDVMRKLTQESHETALLWFGNAETLIPMRGSIKQFQYIASILELLDDSSNALKRKLLIGLARKAKALVACQQTRAYIMRSWWKLDSLPYVMPNKPYGLSLRKNCDFSSDVTREAFEPLKGKKYIIFQGILQHVDFLEQIALALHDVEEDLALVLMGSDERDKTLVHRIKNVYPYTLHIPYIPAPLHLEITSHAYIGVVFYRDDSLNRAYCAPNKIYEYAHFGIPMIANRIPGLIDTIGAAGAAECVDMTRDSIAEAIRTILNSYELVSRNAEQFYHSTDNVLTMTKICDETAIIRRRSEM